MARTTRSPESYAWWAYTGTIIRRVRRRRGLSLAQLGWRTGMSVRVLRKIEAGVLQLKVEEGHAIAVALGVSLPRTIFPPPWFLGYTGETVAAGGSAPAADDPRRVPGPGDVCRQGAPAAPPVSRADV